MVGICWRRSASGFVVVRWCVVGVTRGGRRGLSLIECPGAIGRRYRGHSEIVKKAPQECAVSNCLLRYNPDLHKEYMRGEENLCLRLVGNFESMNEELVMNDMNVELDPRDLEVGMEWDAEEPALDLDDVPVFDRGRVRDTMDVSELFDDPEDF